MLRKLVSLLVVIFILGFSLHSFGASQRITGSSSYWHSAYNATCNVSATGYYNDSGPYDYWYWTGCSSIDVSANVYMFDGYYCGGYSLTNKWGDSYTSNSDHKLTIEGGGRLKVYYGTYPIHKLLKLA